MLLAMRQSSLILVSRKAKQLGVEVRVERRLAAGDISLRSWLLATPVGARLYKLSRGHQSEVQPRMMPVNHNAAGAVTLTSPWSDWLPLDCWRILRASSY